VKKFILVLFLVGILLVSGVFTALATEAPVTITWWHIQTAEAEKVLWQRLADMSIWTLIQTLTSRF
jgi:ABC-type glycerol-3-phosphate transport system substrate-binding protein